MKTRMLTLLVVSAALTGCATPLPVVDTPIYDKTLPFQAANFEELKKSMLGYHHAYMTEAKNKREKHQAASEVSFYSSILGLIGGAVESLNTVIAGATGAAAGGIYNDRYQLQV